MSMRKRGWAAMLVAAGFGLAWATEARAEKQLPCELALAGSAQVYLDRDGHIIGATCTGNPSDCCRW